MKAEASWNSCLPFILPGAAPSNAAACTEQAERGILVMGHFQGACWCPVLSCAFQIGCYKRPSFVWPIPFPSCEHRVLAVATCRRAGAVTPRVEESWQLSDMSFRRVVGQASTKGWEG